MFHHKKQSTKLASLLQFTSRRITRCRPRYLLLLPSFLRCSVSCLIHPATKKSLLSVSVKSLLFVSLFHFSANCGIMMSLTCLCSREMDMSLRFFRANLIISSSLSGLLTRNFGILSSRFSNICTRLRATYHA